MEHFRLQGPGYVSFSGGRTSGLMLRRILDAGLEPDVHVIFANTGKERVETLDFVAEVSERWGVPIVWLERPDGGGYREVTRATASVDGRPFADLIRSYGYLPHPGAPWCSSELKFRVAREWMRARGYQEWDVAIGLRADERRRVARIQGRKVEGGFIHCPLSSAGLDEGDVRAFWSTQPFDLRLHQHEGNCDLCWKKSSAKIGGLVDQSPSMADWWAEQERATGKRWRNDRPTYEAMADAARRQVRLNLIDDGGEPCEVCS